MYINEVTLLGSIKEISNILTLKNGQQCCWLNIIADISYQKKNGSKGHRQSCHRVIVCGKNAHVIKEKASIDQKVFIQGKLTAISWADNNTFFKKEFIILERFKLQTLTKKPENYNQLGGKIEDETDFTTISNWSSYYDDNDRDNYYDMVVSLELLQETGWYYSDGGVDELLMERDPDHMDFKK